MKTAAGICDAIEGVTGDQTAGLALALLKDGYREGLWPINPRSGAVHAWSWLTPTDTLTLWTTITTGAVAITGVAGTIATVAAATFFPSMVGHTIVADTSQNEYTVAGYTSSTVITLSADASTDRGETFTITATGDYALPSDFGGIIGPVVYEYSATEEGPRLYERSPEWIDVQHREDNTAGLPEYWCIKPRTYVEATGQRFELGTYPITDATRVVKFRQRIAVSPDAITDAAVYLRGGEGFDLLWEELALKHVELDKGKPGYWTREADRRLAAMIAFDQALLGSHDVAESLYDSD